MMLKPQSRVLAGFTLIELLVVVAIIGILSSITIIAFTNSIRQSRDAKLKFHINQITKGIQLYNESKNSYPVGTDDTGPAGQGIDYNFTGTFIAPIASEGYISAVPYEPGFLKMWYVWANTNANNVTIRTVACQDNPADPLPKAVLIFWLEDGVSKDYRASNIGNGNAICFY